MNHLEDRFEAGEVDCKDDCPFQGMYTARIDHHRVVQRRDGNPGMNIWGSRIEVHGHTETEAVALRALVIMGLRAMQEKARGTQAKQEAPKPAAPLKRRLTMRRSLPPAPPAPVVGKKKSKKSRCTCTEEWDDEHCRVHGESNHRPDPEAYVPEEEWQL